MTRLAGGSGRRLLAAGVVVAGGLGLGTLGTPVVRAEGRALAAAEVESPKLVVVKFHADWCGRCRAMEGPTAEARGALVDEPVLFVKFDFTDQSKARQSEFLASVTGFEAVWDTYERQTGFSLVVNAETGEVVTELRTPDAAAIEASIREHL
ncbi:MAG: thioredoxin domain-containing protein [Planctomycetota bacterium]